MAVIFLFGVLFLFLPWFQIVVRVASKILQFLSPQHQRYCVFSMSVMCSAFVLGLQNIFLNIYISLFYFSFFPYSGIFFCVFGISALNFVLFCVQCHILDTFFTP